MSRVLQRLEIRTPFVSAGVEGTEFALRVGGDRTDLWVYEGRVRFANGLGSLPVSGGESAFARRGGAPQRRIAVHPREAVQWALYYPPLIDARPERYPAALRPAVWAYRRNELQSAITALDAVPDPQRDDAYYGLRAGLLLSVGRVAETERDIAAALKRNPRNGTASALRAVIAVVRNQSDEALRLAQQAIESEPQSPAPYTARSYAEQSAFRIEDALKSAQHAAQVTSADALVWARIAELESSLGDLDASLEAAKKAEQLDPRLARTQTVLGFAELTRIEVDAAKRRFTQASRLDPADPLPRLGLGLAKIREGDVDEGTQEIEIAAALDPGNSLVRSYLGKAYYEQKRAGLASTEFEQAKLLDPKDPTPWFYDAIHKQTTNRPVEALHDLQKAIDLNDNRAVYRSRLLLDEDLAARSAALGRVYSDLGFEKRALVEGWKSVNTEPSDYSGHRLLADSYSAIPRHNIARVSELLQAQLLQPINVTPVQPSLAESNLLALDTTGPQRLAFNEYGPLFIRNRLAFQASGVYGNKDTYGDEITHSAVWDNLSYSLGQFHFETEGFRPNNDVAHDIYNGFVQIALSPMLSVQVEAMHREVEHGDLQLRFDKSFDPVYHRTFRTDAVRFGAHGQPSSNADVIASVIYQNEKDQEDGSDTTTVNNEGYVAETQFHYRASHFRLLLGGGYTRVDGDIDKVLETDVWHRNAYMYSYFSAPQPILWTLGVSFDSLSDDDLGSATQTNPKLGVTWNVTRMTTLRLAAFRTLKRPLLSDQTIEPSQIAGFNQFFDDSGGTEAYRYGVGIDQKFTENLYGGLEISQRDVKVPIAAGEQIKKDDWNEHEYEAYLYWTPSAQWALSGSWHLEWFEADLLAPDTRTHRAPLQLRYFGDTGLFGQVGVTYVNQAIEFDENSPDSSEQFALVDTSIGFRFPRRYGVFRVNVNNVLDQGFRYQGLEGRTEKNEPPPFFPERTILAQVLLYF